jgi:hypothetical protein
MGRNDDDRYYPRGGMVPFMAIIVLLLGVFWYMFTIGVIVTLDKRECNRLNIGETCIIMAVPE